MSAWLTRLLPHGQEETSEALVEKIRRVLLSEEAVAVLELGESFDIC